MQVRPSDRPHLNEEELVINIQKMHIKEPKQQQQQQEEQQYNTSLSRSTSLK